MIVLDINLTEDFLDKISEGKSLIHLADGEVVRLGAFPHGMQTGKPSVAFGFEVGDEAVVVAEMSFALLLTAVDTLKAKYGDPRD